MPLFIRTCIHTGRKTCPERNAYLKFMLGSPLGYLAVAPVYIYIYIYFRYISIYACIYDIDHEYGYSSSTDICMIMHNVLMYMLCLQDVNIEKELADNEARMNELMEKVLIY